MNHSPDCRWEQTAVDDCQYRATHHYCPHDEHACTCPPKSATPVTVAAGELERLRAWKAEAMEVLGAWEKVWEAAGQPGPLGGLKAENTLRWVTEMDAPTAMNCPPAWAGEHSDTYAYCLAGALSSVMLPPDAEMPTEEIAAAIERINTTGPGRSDEGSDAWGDHMYDAGNRETASTIEFLQDELFHLARLATAGWVGEATGRDRNLQLYVARLAHRHRQDVLGGRLKALITWPMAVLRSDGKAEA